MNAQLRPARPHLAIGPRNRRRLFIGVGVSLAVIGAVVAAVLSGGSTSHDSAPTLTVVASPAAIRYQTNRSKVIFGMTHQEVRQLVGPPTKIVGTCWQYPPYQSTFRGRTYTSADRLCFYAGRYSTNEFWLNGKWQVSCATGACRP